MKVRLFKRPKLESHAREAVAVVGGFHRCLLSETSAVLTDAAQFARRVKSAESDASSYSATFVDKRHDGNRVRCAFAQINKM